MKYLITCLIVAVLAGCDKTPDTSQGTTAESGVATDNSTTANTEGGNIVPRGSIIKSGIFKGQRTSGIIEDPNTTTGKAVRGLVLEFVERTNRIPLVKGSYLGYQYRIFQLPPELWEKSSMEMRRVFIHPEMTLPDGTKTTGSDYTVKRRISSGQVIAYDAYGFHEDYEMVEGDWTFQHWYKDNLLVEQKFTTYWPEEEAGGDTEPAEPAAEDEI